MLFRPVASVSHTSHYLVFQVFVYILLVHWYCCRWCWVDWKSYHHPTF